jgi:hypothetical protein
VKKQMKEIIFEVLEQPMGQGFLATAIGVGIHTEADTLGELHANVREAVDCHFDESMEPANIIRLHFVHDNFLEKSSNNLSQTSQSQVRNRTSGK